MGALDEALNASVNNTLMIPVDEMKQSSLEVSGSVASVRQMVDDVKASADEIKGASDDVRNSASEVNATASELKATIEELKSSVSGAAFSTEDMKVSAQEIRSTTDALKNSNDELKTQVKNTVDNALLTMRRENREIADHLEYIRSTVENIHNPSEDDLVRKMEEEAKRAEEERNACRELRKIRLQFRKCSELLMISPIRRMLRFIVMFRLLLKSRLRNRQIIL